MTTTCITCTLCAAEAMLFAVPNSGRYLALECQECGQFVVSEAADKRIRGLSLETKNDYRQDIASAQDGEILLMIVEPIGSGGGLKVELVLRASLRL